MRVVLPLAPESPLSKWITQQCYWVYLYKYQSLSTIYSSLTHANVLGNDYPQISFVGTTTQQCDTSFWDIYKDKIKVSKIMFMVEDVFILGTCFLPTNYSWTATTLRFWFHQIQALSIRVPRYDNQRTLTRPVSSFDTMDSTPYSSSRLASQISDILVKGK